MLKKKKGPEFTTMELAGKIKIDTRGAPRLKCPDCRVKMKKLYVWFNEVPFFSGFGSCKCRLPV